MYFKQTRPFRSLVQIFKVFSLKKEMNGFFEAVNKCFALEFYSAQTVFLNFVLDTLPGSKIHVVEHKAKFL